LVLSSFRIIYVLSAVVDSRKFSHDLLPVSAKLQCFDIMV